VSDNAFSPQGNTFSVTTSGTTLTPLSQAVSFATPASSQPAAQATGLGMCPPQIRIVNTSSGYVYLSVTSAPRTAAVPGTNPSLEVALVPNSDRVLSLQQFPGLNGLLYINTIAVGVSAQLICTFGEGR